MNADLTCEQLAELVAQKSDMPLTPLAVAAMLESFGMRERDSNRYGRSSLFELATEVYGRVRLMRANQPAQSKRHTATTPTNFWRNYRRGAFSMLPVLFHIAFVLLLGNTLIVPREMTALFMGLMLSYFASGGVIQLLSEFVYPAIQEKQYKNAFFYLKRIAATLGAICVGGLVLGGGLATALRIGSIESLSKIAVYFALFSVLWFVLAILQVQEQYRAMLSWVSAMTLAVSIGTLMFPAQAVLVHWTVLSLAVVLLAAWGVEWFRNNHENRSKAWQPLPRIGTTMITGIPVFVFGILYYAVLFADKLVSWSVVSSGVTQFYQIHPSYEMGLALAMVPFLLQAPFFEHTMQAKSTLVVPLLESQDIHATAHVKQRIIRFQLQQIAGTAGIGLAGLALVTLVLLFIRWQFPQIEILQHNITLFVYLVGAIGYLTFGLALQNITFLRSLRQQQAIIWAMLISLLANFGVGWYCTHYAVLGYNLGYSGAVFGLLAGTATLWLVTAVPSLLVLKRWDYYYYATV